MCTRTVVKITIGSKNIFFQFCKDFEKATNLFSFNYEFVILCTIRIPHTKCWPNFFVPESAASDQFAILLIRN